MKKLLSTLILSASFSALASANVCYNHSKDLNSIKKYQQILETRLVVAQGQIEEQGALLPDALKTEIASKVSLIIGASAAFMASGTGEMILLTTSAFPVGGFLEIQTNKSWDKKISKALAKQSKSISLIKGASIEDEMSFALSQIDASVEEFLKIEAELEKDSQTDAFNFGGDDRRFVELQLIKASGLKKTYASLNNQLEGLKSSLESEHCE